jgi:beta-hydroxylase
MFHFVANFPFTRVLEDHVDEIRAEAELIRPLMHDWYETKLHDKGWQVYGLFDFPSGELIAENASRCPITTALIAEHLPSHGAVGFSLLKPHSHIRPHHGYGGGLLRCHLPLVVPPGDCALRVGPETRPWKEGRCIVFDDTTDHEAWNLTDSPRIVLLADFMPSMLNVVADRLK